MVATVALLGGCGTEQSPAGVTLGVAPSSFQVRQVLQEIQAPGGSCASNPAEAADTSKQTTTCSASGVSLLSLGAAITTASDIGTINASSPVTGFWQIDIALTDPATENFRLASEQLVPLVPPLNSLAILIDGKVSSVATVREPVTNGKITVNGLSEAAVKEYVGRFDP